MIIFVIKYFLYFDFDYILFFLRTIQSILYTIYVNTVNINFKILLYQVYVKCQYLIVNTYRNLKKNR
jgi:hypothetical protein